MHSYGPLDVPVSFVGKCILSPLNDLCTLYLTFVEQLSVFDFYVFLWNLYSLLFIFMFILSEILLIPVLPVSLEICYEPCLMVLFGQNYFCYFQCRNLANITVTRKSTLNNFAIFYL